MPTNRSPYAMPRHTLPLPRAGAVLTARSLRYHSHPDHRMNGRPCVSLCVVELLLFEMRRDMYKDTIHVSE